ncbi:MAG: DUF2207 domain-containing protein [Anaerolineae bacterium]|nr:DUF2207 domain-containing protein [Anaerolineae bacterium]
MRTTLRRWLLVLTGVVCLALLLVGTGQAQSSVVNYPRYDVNYAIQRDGSILVSETQTVDFQGTSRRRAFTEIPLVKIEDMTDIAVSEPNGPAYARGDAQAANTYLFNRRTAANGDPVMRIEWAFQPTSTQRTFILQYRLLGALRIADAGDQLYLAAIRSGRAGPIGASTITIALPQAVNASDIRAEGALDGRNTTAGQVSGGQTVTYTLRNIAPDAQYEVRVQFPHGLVTASPPRWQAAAEQQELATERQANIAAVVNLASLILAGFIAVGGGLFVLVTFMTRGRDPQGQALARNMVVREPPSDLPPAVVGTLVDERADERDVVATLIELATHNVIGIQEEANQELLGSNQDFRFTLREGVDLNQLRPFEVTLLRALFGEERQFKMSAMKGKFYASMRQWMDDLYKEVTETRLFIANPEAIRKRYSGIGVGVIVLGGLVAMLGVCLSGLGGLSFLPGLSIVGLGLLFLLIAPHMPKRTPEGVRQATQWRAFQDYLANIQKYEGDQAPQLFNRFLPYAVALGVDQTWVRKLAAVGTPAPPWFQPAANWGPGLPGPYTTGPGPVIIVPGGGYGHGRRHGGYGPGVPGAPGAPGAPGGAGGSGQPPSLDDVSDSLLDMLNRAGRSLSSGGFGGGGGWSSGGGGWGGGGGGGGGSSSGFE